MFTIRIKPDWNVKGIHFFITRQEAVIRIKPDWNVKLLCNQGMYLCARLE